MMLPTSQQSRHSGKIFDDLCLEADAINLKKIGIDTDPSTMVDLKDDLWLTEQFAVSVSYRNKGRVLSPVTIPAGLVYEFIFAAIVKASAQQTTDYLGHMALDEGVGLSSVVTARYDPAIDVAPDRSYHRSWIQV
jgi:hypothetical protein